MKIKCILLVALAIGFSSCVSRTTTRRASVSEMSRGSNGTITTTKIVWIWQGEFWR